VKAALKPRINLQQRTRLEQVIPLGTPMVLFVDPSSACNFRCKFCPNGDRKLIEQTGRWQGQMPLALFTKIIDDLREFAEPLKVLRLYKEGEPLLNRDLAAMIGYAKDKCVAGSIDTTTNGYLLTPERVKPLLDAGLDRINISVDGMSDEQFREFTGVSVRFEQYAANIRAIYEMKGDCEICIKIAGDFLSEEDKAAFFETFGDYADRIFIENVAPCWPEFDVEDRLGVTIEKGIYNQELTAVNTCPYIFYSMSVNSDGSVSLCFLDWARKLLIGDVRQQSVKEIWEGAKLFQHRVEQLAGRRAEHPVCGCCGQLSHGLPDNIDPYAGQLLDKLLASRQGQPQ
jgi:MoaA/NifB/PqqE/SkfB family radical SAM enzyme